MTDNLERLHEEIRVMAMADISERAIAEALGCSLYRVKTALGRETQRIERRGVRPEVAESLERSLLDNIATWQALANGDHQPAIVEGVTAEQATNVDNIWQFAAEAQRVVYEKHARRQRQSITLPDEPIAIAFLSDLHIGSAGADYEAIKADAELVRDTPGLYAGFHGDGTDSWIVGKLTALQRGQAIGFDAERLLFASWVDMIAAKLLWWVQGNHDEWAEKLCGDSPNRALIKDRTMLWDRNQCVFTLNHCGHARRVIIRHKWRFSSVFNPAHGMMVGWDRGDIDFDIAVAGHTHQATLCYPFYKHDKIRHAILTGTYKRIDSFGEEIGFPAPKGRGCGALVFDTDGSQMFIDDLAAATKFLAYLRSR